MLEAVSIPWQFHIWLSSLVLLNLFRSFKSRGFQIFSCRFLFSGRWAKLLPSALDVAQSQTEKGECASFGWYPQSWHHKVLGASCKRCNSFIYLGLSGLISIHLTTPSLRWLVVEGTMAKWPCVELPNYSNSATCSGNLVRVIQWKKATPGITLASNAYLEREAPFFPGCSTIWQTAEHTENWWEAADNSYLANGLSLLRKARELQYRDVCDPRVAPCFCHHDAENCHHDAKKCPKCQGVRTSSIQTVCPAWLKLTW